jgi:hypothetical protein
VIIPANYAQVNLKMTGPAVPTGAQVTFGLDRVGYSGTPAEAAEVVRLQLIANTCFTQVDSNVLLSSILVKYGPNETGAAAEIATGIVGGQSGTAQVPQCAYLLNKNTTAGGRKGRGRFFLPGVPDTAIVEGGTLVSSVAGQMTASWQGFVEDMSAASLPLALLHSQLGDVPNVITSISCQSRVGTQRRRNRR